MQKSYYKWNMNHIIIPTPSGKLKQTEKKSGHLQLKQDLSLMMI